MFSKGKYNVSISPHLNQNYEHSFPGLEMILYEYPFSIGKQDFITTPRIIADIQPKDQRFMTSKGQFVGFAKIDLIWKNSESIQPYLSIEGKTKGCVKGNSFLSNQVGIKAGISLRFN